MPKKSLPPAPAGLLPASAPPTAAQIRQTAPRSFDPGLAKAPRQAPPGKGDAGSRGKSANRLIHAQKARGR